MGVNLDMSGWCLSPDSLAPDASGGIHVCAVFVSERTLAVFMSAREFASGQVSPDVSGWEFVSRYV